MTTWPGTTEMQDGPESRRSGTGVVTGLTALIVLLLAVSGVGLATVGEEDTGDVVSAAAAAYSQATSARIELHQTVRAGGTKIEMTGEQLTDIANGRSSASMELPGGFGNIHVVQDGAAFYARTDRTKSSSGGPGWLKVTIEAKDSVVGGLAQVAGADMGDTLENLRENSIAPEKIGTGTIDGHDVTQYRATLTGQQLAERMNEAELEAIEDSGMDIEDIDTDYDIWVSADGLPRRMEILSDFRGGSSTLRLDIKDYNVPVEIELPAPDTVIRETTVENMIEFQQVFMELGTEAVGDDR